MKKACGYGLLCAGNQYLCGSVPPGLPVYSRYYYTHVWERQTCMCCSGSAPSPVSCLPADETMCTVLAWRCQPGGLRCVSVVYDDV